MGGSTVQLNEHLEQDGGQSALRCTGAEFILCARCRARSGIIKINKAGAVYPSSDLVFAGVCCFCVCLAVPANLSEPVFLSSKQRGCSSL